MRGMYLHAERLLAKAGRQGATGRGLPTLGEGAEGGTERAERSGGLHKRNRGPRRAFSARWGGGARKIGDSPCAAPGQRPQRGLVSILARSTRLIFRVGVAGRNGPAEEGGGRRASGWREGGIVLPLDVVNESSFSSGGDPRSIPPKDGIQWSLADL